VKLLQDNGTFSEPLQQRTLGTQAAERDLVTSRRDPASKFDGLRFSPSDVEGIQ
jgi:hypothetical protein